MAKRNQIQKVGTITNQKSETIKRNLDFANRWNLDIKRDRYTAFLNRIIVIIEPIFSDYNTDIIEKELFYSVGLPYVRKNYYEYLFQFKNTQIYKILYQLKLQDKGHQILLIKLLEFLLNSSEVYNKGDISKQISEAIVLSGLDIQLCKRGSEYVFYPSGAELLDTKVVNDTLNWLEKYPNSREKFHEALILQKKHESVRQVIDTMRLALELFIKQYFNNEKSLENQKELLEKYLKEQDVAKEIRDMFLTLFLFYTRYNNENVKHADNCIELESEYIIYLTGTFIRFLIKVREKEESPNE